MMLVDSAETLAAVRRSLEAHVLPAVEDEFARIQVLAAMRAVDEVHDRLANGDSCARLNAGLEEALEAVAANLGDTDPSAAERLRAALDSLPETPEPRERRGELSARLVDVLHELHGDSRSQILQVLQDNAAQAAGQDTIWACREAIESLQ